MNNLAEKSIKCFNILSFSSIIIVGLSACTTNQTPLISTSTQTVVKTVANETVKLFPTNVQSNIVKVQNATKAVCRFVPTAQTIVALVDNSATTTTVSKLASTICSIVGDKHKRPTSIHRFDVSSGQMVITSYNGIVIQGYFK